MSQKVNRNDPCICGSGKKYKKCCELRVKTKKISATKLHTKNSGGLFNNKAGKISTNFFEKIIPASSTLNKKEISTSTKKVANASLSTAENSTNQKDTPL